MDFVQISFAALIAFFSFLIGGIPFGFLIGRAHGVDIRTVGSHNIGATNVTRTIGPWWGKLCFLCDFLKGFLPTFAVRILVSHNILADPFGILPGLAILFVVGGHIFPVYLKFKGGKGVATAAGAIMAVDPYSTFVALAVWVIVFKISRYVSLASILAAISLPVAAILFHVSGATRTPEAILGLFTVLAMLTICKHKSNIHRLIAGTENRFGAPKCEGDGK